MDRTIGEAAMSSAAHPTPDWDLEQLEVILDDSDSWQLVIAGPEPASLLLHASA